MLDVEMPGNGIVAAARITEHLRGIAVVMLTVSADDEHLFASLRAGAIGYLLKDMDPGRALRGVLSGEAALPRTLVAGLIGEFRSAERRPSLPARIEHPGEAPRARSHGDGAAVRDDRSGR